MITRLKSYLNTCKTVKQQKQNIPLKDRRTYTLDSYLLTLVIYLPIFLVFLNLLIYVRFIYLFIWLIAAVLITFKIFQQVYYYKLLEIKEKHLIINNVLLFSAIIMIIATITTFILRLYI